MSFQDFIEKFNGKYIDFDGQYGAQCFDLFHYYHVQVLGITDPRTLSAPAAKDIYNNFENLYNHDLFVRIPNTPDGVPEEGDIIIWGNGTWGHVAIFIEGDVNSFRSFDQNYPTDSPCHAQNHTYANVLGWIRLKKDAIPVPPELTECQTKLAEETKKKQDNWNWGMEMQTELEGAKAQILTHENNLKAIAGTLKTEAEMPKILGEITKMLSYEDQNRQLTVKNTELANQATVAQQKGLELEEMNKGLSLTNKEQADQLTEDGKMVDSLKEQVTELEQILKDTTTHESLFKIGKLSICKIS